MSISLDFNHPVKELAYIFLLQMQQNMTNKEKLIMQKNIKNAKDNNKIDEICNLFNKICFPKTYQEFINNLSQDDKDKIEYIDNIENEWYHDFLNIEY